jgi:hypothetical protein
VWEKRRGEKDWAFIEGVLFVVRYVRERFIQNSSMSPRCWLHATIESQTTLQDIEVDCPH